MRMKLRNPIFAGGRAAQDAPLREAAQRTVYPILLMACAAHLLNDMMQSVIPAVYPLLKEKFGFSFAQIGLITLVFQMTSSVLQPLSGCMPTAIRSPIRSPWACASRWWGCCCSPWLRGLCGSSCRSA